MRLSKETIEAFRANFANRFTAQQIIDQASLYKQNNLSFTRFIFDLYHTIKNDDKNAIISLTSDATMIGGYFTNVTDNNIETAIKKALFAYTQIDEKAYNTAK